MNTDEELRRLREDIRKLQDQVERRADPVLLPIDIRIMIVTTEIEAMVGSVCGQGEAVEANWNPSTKKLTPGTGDPETIFNDHEHGFLETAIIKIFEWNGSQWVFDVNTCALYQ